MPFLRTKPSIEEPRGTFWRYRVDGDGDGAAGLTWIAEEQATSNGPSAQALEGGAHDTIALTPDDVRWLR